MSGIEKGKWRDQGWVIVGGGASEWGESEMGPTIVHHW